MLIGISGKKQCGKDTICMIIKALDIYYNCDAQISNKGTDVEFVLSCLGGRLTTLEVYRNIISKWEKHAFADKLKQALGVILGVPPGRFEDNDFKNSDSCIVKPDGSSMYTHRELLQRFGTEVGRNISPNVWVDALFAEYCWFDDDEEPFWIVTDVRFESEAKAIKDREGILIRVNRDTGYNDSHISETALDNYDGFDYTIGNADLEGTISKVKSILIENSLI